MIDGVKLTLKGKEYDLVFTMTALIDYEQLTGMNALTENIIKETIGLKQIREFLYVILKQENPELTIEDCGNLVEVHRIGDVMKAIIQAFNLGMPEPGKEPKKKVTEK